MNINENYHNNANIINIKLLINTKILEYFPKFIYWLIKFYKKYQLQVFFLGKNKTIKIRIDKILSKIDYVARKLN